ncbi:MAG: hypothetical protein NC048_00970 [Bacteroides sp.]|nr:hypothetical protein [Ruminococcus flavefaciens]MCM1554052.1 hypothetical protein [Bacteroides sp.]
MKKVMLLAFVAVMFVTSCTDEDKATLSKTHYTLYHSKTERIQGKNVEDVEWRSANDFVATISNGMIEGQYVGNTSVKSKNNGLSFSVNVVPQYNLYDEPDIEWGASLATIKSRYGTPYSSSSTALIYESSNPDVPYYVYTFNNTGLYTSGVVVRVSAASTLANFLMERYVALSVDMNTYTATFAHCSGEKNNPQIDYAVGMRYYSSLGGILVAYAKGTNAKSDIDSLLEQALTEGNVKL